MATTKQDRWVTIPNGLCLVRLIGSFAIIPAVIAGRPRIALLIFLVLAMTDWIDGKIARWFDQRSRIGPRLDSAADVTMYIMLFFALIWLRFDTFRAELAWELSAISAFVIACGTAWIKFRSFPSYHTRTAKVSWFLVVVAAIGLFLDWTVWPLRIASVAIVVANLESTAITCTLSRPRTDVISLAAARRLEREGRAEASEVEQ